MRVIDLQWKSIISIGDNHEWSQAKKTAKTYMNIKRTIWQPGLLNSQVL